MLMKLDEIASVLCEVALVLLIKDLEVYRTNKKPNKDLVLC